VRISVDDVRPLREFHDGRVHLLAVVDDDDPSAPSAELELLVELARGTQSPLAPVGGDGKGCPTLR
jgi:hypothetical protein